MFFKNKDTAGNACGVHFSSFYIGKDKKNAFFKKKNSMFNVQCSIFLLLLHSQNYIKHKTFNFKLSTINFFKGV